MRTYSYYECEICGERYETEKRCRECERSHCIADIMIDTMVYQAYVEYPKIVYLKIDNKTIPYYRGNESE